MPAEITETAAEVAYDVLSTGVQVQGSHADALDAKLGLFIATGSGLVGLVVAVLALSPIRAGSSGPGLIATFSTYAIVLLAAGWGILPRQWDGWIKSDGLLDVVEKGGSGAWLRDDAMKALFHAYRNNRPRLDRKGWAVKVTFIALVAEAVSFLVVLVPLAK